MKKNKKKIFLEKFKQSMGIISTAAMAAGINRCTYYEWREKDEKFKIATDDILESAGDFAESKLLYNIQEGKEASIIFYCKTKLKTRGYVERVESTGADGRPLVPATSAIPVFQTTEEAARAYQEAIKRIT